MHACIVREEREGGGRREWGSAACLRGSCLSAMGPRPAAPRNALCAGTPKPSSSRCSPRCPSFLPGCARRCRATPVAGLARPLPGSRGFTRPWQWGEPGFRSRPTELARATAGRPDINSCRHRPLGTSSKGQKKVSRGNAGMGPCTLSVQSQAPTQNAALTSPPPCAHVRDPLFPGPRIGGRSLACARPSSGLHTLSQALGSSSSVARPSAWAPCQRRGPASRPAPTAAAASDSATRAS